MSHEHGVVAVLTTGEQPEVPAGEITLPKHYVRCFLIPLRHISSRD
jgi:hypothetical protein